MLSLSGHSIYTVRSSTSRPIEELCIYKVPRNYWRDSFLLWINYIVSLYISVPGVAGWNSQ